MMVLLFLLAVGIILLMLIGFIYKLLGALPSSPSGDPQLFPLEQRTAPSHRVISSTTNRKILAVLTGGVWFFLWILFLNVMENKLGQGPGLHLAKAFGYGTVTLAGSLATIWCGVYLWKQLRQG
jgi:hypothetical protein